LHNLRSKCISSRYSEISHRSSHRLSFTSSGRIHMAISICISINSPSSFCSFWLTGLLFGVFSVRFSLRELIARRRSIFMLLLLLFLSLLPGTPHLHLERPPPLIPISVLCLIVSLYLYLNALNEKGCMDHAWKMKNRGNF